MSIEFISPLQRVKGIRHITNEVVLPMQKQRGLLMRLFLCICKCRYQR